MGRKMVMVPSKMVMVPSKMVPSGGTEKKAVKEREQAKRMQREGDTGKGWQTP
jgi:hypothetical protein